MRAPRAHTPRAILAGSAAHVRSAARLAKGAIGPGSMLSPQDLADHRGSREGLSVEVFAAVVLTMLFAAALAVIFGVTAWRDSGAR